MANEFGNIPEDLLKLDRWTFNPDSAYLDLKDTSPETAQALKELLASQNILATIPSDNKEKKSLSHLDLGYIQVKGKEPIAYLRNYLTELKIERLNKRLFVTEKGQEIVTPVKVDANEPHLNFLLKNHALLGKVAEFLEEACLNLSDHVFNERNSTKTIALTLNRAHSPDTKNISLSEGTQEWLKATMPYIARFRQLQALGESYAVTGKISEKALLAAFGSDGVLENGAAGNDIQDFINNRLPEFISGSFYYDSQPSINPHAGYIGNIKPHLSNQENVSAAASSLQNKLGQAFEDAKLIYEDKEEEKRRNVPQTIVPEDSATRVNWDAYEAANKKASEKSIPSVKKVKYSVNELQVEVLSHQRRADEPIPDGIYVHTLQAAGCENYSNVMLASKRNWAATISEQKRGGAFLE